MLDCHIHIERGSYTLGWINEFVQVAAQRGLDEIWLLEHCYRFREFVPMYDKPRAYGAFFNEWFRNKAGFLALADYLKLVDMVRGRTWPVQIKFGLEVCYFQEHEALVRRKTQGKGLDFLVGSVHFIGDFAFDHKQQAERWDGINVDEAYRTYFETSIQLAESGLFNGIAHPDLIKLFGHRPSFALDKTYDKLAAALAKNNMYTEQNGGAHRRCPATCEPGMDKGLLAAMLRHNVKIQTASDAHCPEDVGLLLNEREETRYGTAKK